MKHKISSHTIRKANKSLIRDGISERSRKGYNGDINVRVNTKTGYVTRSFSNNDIKVAFKKAKNIYVERI